MSTPNLLKLGIFMPSSAVGGAEHYVKNIITLVEKAGFQAVVILSKDRNLIDFFADLNVECIISDIAWSGGEEDLEVGDRYLQKLSRQYREAIAVLNSINLDCAFVNLPWVDFGLGISLACHDLKIPCINLVHLCPWKVDLNSLTKQLFQELAAANSRFFTVSDDNRTQLSLSTGIDRDSIEVFHNSRDVESKYIGLTSKEHKLHRLELLEELGLPLNSFLSVSVGRFSHQKNFLDIITTFSTVEAKLANYYHLFLGEGELQEYYQAAVTRLGIADKLKFLGYRQDVDRFLALSDLFISSSLYEGLALSILEAAQFSCPIVATDASSAKEIIPNADYGLLYNPGQYSLLAKHIEYAYFHGEAMKEKARKLKLLCQEKFSLTKFETQLKNILQTVTTPANTQSQLSVSYDEPSEMLEVNPNYNTANYRFSGLPTSIVKPTDAIAFPLINNAKELVHRKHEQYLHCSYKVAKKLRHHKAILCFGDFDPNFFRNHYSQENYLLLVISVENRNVNFKVCQINHTCWGQNIEPEYIAKFTTFDTSADLIKFRAKLSENNSRHYYTTKNRLQSYYRLPNDSNLDSLSLNLKAIESLFQPTEYYLLEKDRITEKITMRLISRRSQIVDEFSYITV